jgi:hypothetical protein
VFGKNQYYVIEHIEEYSEQRLKKMTKNLTRLQKLHKVLEFVLKETDIEVEVQNYDGLENCLTVNRQADKLVVNNFGQERISKENLLESLSKLIEKQRQEIDLQRRYNQRMAQPIDVPDEIRKILRIK